MRFSIILWREDVGIAAIATIRMYYHAATSTISICQSFRRFRGDFRDIFWRIHETVENSGIDRYPQLANLIGGIPTYPPEKYEFVRLDHHPVPIGENKSHVPNHQPAMLANRNHSAAQILVPALLCGRGGGVPNSAVHPKFLQGNRRSLANRSTGRSTSSIPSRKAR